MKKEQKIHLKEKLVSYLRETNINIKRSFSGRTYYFYDNKKNDNISDYSIDDYLSAKTVDDIEGFFKFVSYLKKTDDKYFIYRLLSDKAPAPTKYDTMGKYSGYNKNAMAVLKDDQDLLLMFITKNKFITNSKEVIDALLNEKYFNKKNTEVLFEYMNTLDEAKEVNYKNYLYKIYMNHIDDKDKYSHLFKSFLEKESRQIIKNKDKLDTYKLTVNPEELLWVSSSRDFNTYSIDRRLGTLKLFPFEDLEIKDFILRENKKSIDIIFMGDNLNYKLLDAIVENVIKFQSIISNVNEAKEIISIARYELLKENIIADNKDSVRKKL